MAKMEEEKHDGVATTEETSPETVITSPEAREAIIAPEDLVEKDLDQQPSADDSDEMEDGEVDEDDDDYIPVTKAPIAAPVPVAAKKAATTPLDTYTRGYLGISFAADSTQAPEIVLSHLPLTATENDLRTYFNEFGSIAACSLAAPSATVTFSDLAALNRVFTAPQHELLSTVVLVAPAPPSLDQAMVSHHEATYPNSGVHLSNLLPTMTEQAIKSEMSVFGVISNIHLVLQPKEGSEFGFGFVTYQENRSAALALTAASRLIDGQEVKINTTRKPSRPQSEHRQAYNARHDSHPYGGRGRGRGRGPRGDFQGRGGRGGRGDFNGGRGGRGDAAGRGGRGGRSGRGGRGDFTGGRGGRGDFGGGRGGRGDFGGGRGGRGRGGRGGRGDFGGRSTAMDCHAPPSAPYPTGPYQPPYQSPAAPYQPPTAPYQPPSAVPYQAPSYQRPSYQQPPVAGGGAYSRAYEPPSPYASSYDSHRGAQASGYKQSPLLPPPTSQEYAPSSAPYKPSYSNDHAPPPPSSRYDGTRYAAPPSRYDAPPTRNEAPPSRYDAPPPRYDATPTRYEAPPSRYDAPPPRYDAPPQRYDAPPPQRYDAPPPSAYDNPGRHDVGPPYSHSYASPSYPPSYPPSGYHPPSYPHDPRTRPAYPPPAYGPPY